MLNILLQETIDLIAPLNLQAYKTEIAQIEQSEQQEENELIKETKKWGFVSINQSKELRSC